MAPLSLAFAPGSLGAGPVQVTWLGTAGFAIRCEGHTLLLDPYLTRASLGSCVLCRLATDQDLLRRQLPSADAIVLGHTHFDHALDAPTLARFTGARVFGSRSAVRLCRASGVAESQLCDVEEHARYAPYEDEIGPFRLRFVPSVHSKLALGRVPFAGEITDCDELPSGITGYRCGAVFGVEIRVAGRTLYHVGSADLVEEQLGARGVGIDLALVCVAGWTSTPRYPERLLRTLGPRAILLSHWDDFFRPLSEPVRALPAMRLPALVDRFTSATKDVLVGTVPLLGAVDL
jgi:L-ascorbate metabolism protein UlaG (beta-lactamase superfamily)